MLRLVEQLPWDSRYKLAVADDEDLAARVLPEGDDGHRGARPVPPLTEWSELKDLRAAILDGLASLERTIIGVNTPRGRRVPDLRPQPRPLTAAMRLAQRRKDTAMDELENRITGRG